jgi:hypothetical protein
MHQAVQGIPVLLPEVRGQMSGDCNHCEMYIGDRCLKAEKMFSGMTDPICLQKMSIMLLRDMNENLMDFMYEDED